MKTNPIILIIALLLITNFSIAQQDEECMANLSIFDSYAKNKKYDEAYEPWSMVRNKCPKFNRAIYVRGEKILKHKIKNTSGADQVAHIKDLIKLYDQARENFASKYPIGKVKANQAQLYYKYKKELGATDEDIYKLFNECYTQDAKNFTSAQGLYTYFSLMVDMYDAGKKQSQELFDKYDDIIEVIESLEKSYTLKLNKLIEKEDSGAELTKKESKYKKNYSANLEAFEKVVGSMDKKLGDRANCKVLIKLYGDNFEANKNNEVWLQRAMNRMYAKDCKEDPLFVKLVEQKNTLSPNADTAYYLYLITGEQKYFNETIALETDNLKKAKLFTKLADDLRKKGSYGKARTYYNKALKLNPSNGLPYLRIASMYAKAAKNCGDTNFNKRSVFFLAASTAEKAGRVDSRLKKTATKTAASYRASAPSTSEIFSATMGGKKLSIGCWIGISITIPQKN